MSSTEDLGLYLGMPSLHGLVTKSTFSFLCEKVDRKLAGWKSRFFSLAGRSTLAQSTLSSMAVYSMQTAKIPRSICDEIDRKTKSSNLWKGIAENAKHINSGVHNAVGNGRTTLFWDHKWVINQPLIEVATKDVPETILGVIVEEMWDCTQGWKRDTFAEFLPISILQKIQACEVLVKNDLEAQNSLRFFLWLLMHEKILCNANGVKRGLTEDPIYPLCHQMIETCMHTLRDNQQARNVWVQICPNNRVRGFFSGSSVQSWVEENLTSSKVRKPDYWAYAFPLTLWWIWKWRNQSIFRNGEDTPLDKKQFIKLRVEETKHAIQKDLNLAINSIKKQEAFITWVAPHYEWIALNTVGSAKGCSGAAGTGLELTWERGIKKMDVRKDNKACTQILANTGSHQGPYLQEANMAADWLAKKGVDQANGLCIEECPPPSLSRILDADSRSAGRGGSQKSLTRICFSSQARFLKEHPRASFVEIGKRLELSNGLSEEESRLGR
ncbi:hypothetical protein RDABS01_039198 [Bienertia sinuspersici]